MSEEELKEWFWNKFNSCYYVKHEDYTESLFMFYDKDFIRKYKFRILQGKEIVYPENPSGVCLFHQDYKNGVLWCDYNYIWSHFEPEYKYMEIQSLINSWIGEIDKLTELVTDIKDGKYTFDLYDNKILFPEYDSLSQTKSIKENNKYKKLLSSYTYLNSNIEK